MERNTDGFKKIAHGGGVIAVHASRCCHGSVEARDAKTGKPAGGMEHSIVAEFKDLCGDVWQIPMSMRDAKVLSKSLLDEIELCELHRKRGVHDCSTETH